VYCTMLEVDCTMLEVDCTMLEVAAENPRSRVIYRKEGELGMMVNDDECKG
jgi:hypothetical protein